MILAVGEAVDLDFVRASGLRIKEDGTLEVDRYTLETSRSKFYAGGDVITGASNVSNAMGYGKKAARNIDSRADGQRPMGRTLPPSSNIARAPPEQPSECRRHELDGTARRASACASFEEAVLGLSADRGAGGRQPLPALRHQGARTS